MITCPSLCIILEYDQEWANGKPCPYCPSNMTYVNKEYASKQIWARQYELSACLTLEDWQGLQARSEPEAEKLTTEIHAMRREVVV